MILAISYVMAIIYGPYSMDLMKQENYPANHQTDDANNESDNHFDTNSIFNGFIIITLSELVTKFTRARSRLYENRRSLLKKRYK